MQDPKLNVIYRFHISRGWHLQLESIRMGLFGQQTPHVSCEGGFQKVAIFLGSYARVFWIFFKTSLSPLQGLSSLGSWQICWAWLIGE